MKTHTLLFCLLFATAITLSSQEQTFSFQMLSDTIMLGQPGGNDIVIEGNIINNSSANLEIDIIRVENNLPNNWYSYICVDVCLSPFTDSTRLYLPPFQSQSFKLSFIIDSQIDTANCLIPFKNTASSANKISKRLYGATNTAAGLYEQHSLSALSIYPNPSKEILCVKSVKPFKTLEVFNARNADCCRRHRHRRSV